MKAPETAGVVFLKRFWNQLTDAVRKYRGRHLRLELSNAALCDWMGIMPSDWKAHRWENTASINTLEQLKSRICCFTLVDVRVNEEVLDMSIVPINETSGD